MSIRIARDEDLSYFEDFCASESLGTGWSLDSFQGALTQATDRLWIALEEHRLVGFLMTRVVAGEAELLNIVVAKARRGAGLGRQLMSAWLAQMKDEMVERLFLEVRVSNAPAIALYESFGFEGVGTRVGYYQPDLEDALVMARSL